MNAVTIEEGKNSAEVLANECICRALVMSIGWAENGASEGIRTLDTHVGNVMLYQAELRSRPN
ncbi:MAG: hypothetical protein JWR26_4276 [Pedosphaera sp.]|nr:hypothetical protein [Pedosphaera sp.]